MSLQMPPEGGGYNRSPHSGIFIPRDLVAQDSSGDVVPLPAWVGRDILERMPQAIAREFEVVPLRVEPGDGTIELLRPGEAKDDLEAEAKLRFILNRPILCRFAPRVAIARLIDFAYLDGEIQNCDRSLSSLCPRTFQRLATTDDARCRICPVCDKAVRIEASEALRRLRESAGLLYAVTVRSEVTEILQEFVSSSNGDAPSEAVIAWPAWPPTRRPRYEILELPEALRGDATEPKEQEPPAVK